MHGSCRGRAVLPASVSADAAVAYRRLSERPSHTLWPRPNLASSAEPTYLVGKLAHADRLGQVAVEARAEEPLAVALHSERRQRYNGNRRSLSVLLQSAQDIAALHIRKPDVHEDDVWGFERGELQCVFPGSRLQRPKPCVAKDVAREPEVPIVVVDDQDKLAHAVSLCEIGSSKWNVLPSPTTLSSHSRPPCSSTKRRASGRPRPVPSSPLPAWRNASKIRSASCAAIPGPVSATATSTFPSRRSADTSTTPPAGVNFTALERRLKTTCRSFRSSASSVISAGSTVSRSSTPRRAAVSALTVTPLSSTVRSETGESSSSIRPDSTLARSRRSLMSASRWCP